MLIEMVLSDRDKVRFPIDVEPDFSRDISQQSLPVDKTGRDRQASARELGLRVTELQEAQQLLDKLERTPRLHSAFDVIRRIVKDRELLRTIVIDGVELLL